MKRILAAALAVAATIGLPAAAEAHGGWHGGFHGGHHEWHRHGGIFIGPAFGWPGPFDDPFFQFPPAPIVVQPPPVYIERGNDSGALASSGQFWYYCESAGAYYPYVKQCPEGWKTVLPRQR